MEGEVDPETEGLALSPVIRPRLCARPLASRAGPAVVTGKGNCACT
jgi:hypothetical protein